MHKNSDYFINNVRTNISISELFMVIIWMRTNWKN